MFFSDDHSRVILEKIGGNELTDFINANHVDVCIFQHYKHSKHGQNDNVFFQRKSYTIRILMIFISVDIIIFPYIQ